MNRFAMDDLSADGPDQWHTSLAQAAGRSLGEKSNKSRTDTLNSLRGPS